MVSASVAGLLLVGGCARDGGETGPSPEHPGGATVSTPSAQSSPGDPGGTPSPVPSGTSAPPGPTVSDAPALPLPTRRIKPSPGEVTVTGTVAFGVEPNCVLLNQYLLLGGPRELFTAGALVTVTGRVEPDRMTTCQQGTPLVVTSARRG